MIESSRPRLRRFANLGGLAIALALCGCGIKGPLEAPPSATLAASPPSATVASSPPSATPAAAKSKDAKKEPPRTADLSSEKTPMLEQSTVRGVKQQGFLPPKTPVEWKKDKDRHPGPIKRPGPTTTPDDPFFLDWLL